MKRFFFIIAFVSMIFSIQAENKMSGWKYYLSYSSTNSVEESTDLVYVVANGSLFSYGKEDNSINQYLKGQELNDNDITFIRYNKTSESLLIVYSNYNIDILEKSTVKNISFLKTNTNFKNKTINNITIHNELAYLSTAFGIVVINMEKKEIKETYNLGINITSCAILGDHIYASTTNTQQISTSILYAPLNENLLDKGIWKTYPSKFFSPSTVATKIVTFQDRLIFFVRYHGIYYENNHAITALVHNNQIQDIKMVGDRLGCIAPNNLYLYSNLKDKEEISNITLKDISTYQTDLYWIAEKDKGLRSIKRKGTNNFEPQNEPIILDGPQMNSPYKMVCKNNKVYIIPGGIALTAPERFNNAGTIMIYDYDKWSYIDYTTVKDKFKIRPRDYTSIAIKTDPANGDEHIYTTSQGDGLIHYINGEAVNLFDEKNSPIENALVSTHRYYNTNGAAFDKDGNLWVANSEADKAIKIIDKEGKWHALAISSLAHLYNIHEIFITSYGDKWINVPRPADQARLVVLSNRNGSLDEVKEYAYKSFIDTDGNGIYPQVYSSIAEDKEQKVWVGTDKGVIYFVNPKVLASENKESIRCNRVKLINEETETPYYFLDNILVTTLKIDCGNQKWIGTEGNGVYVLSADNQSVVHQFNTSNSPLPSDNIYDIEINNETGEVFIGTDKGLVSYKGEATEGQENYSNVYAYPNPVRPEYNDKVTITGLMDNSMVKITDLNGNLIYQTRSYGGQISWNCRNTKGSRVATGVYLVLSATEDAKESVVTKIAVIK